MRRTADLHASQTFDYGPLFGGSDFAHPRPQSTAVDHEERLTWARRAVLLCSLETFTAEDVRELTARTRPHYLGSGRWIGSVFSCSLFEKVCAEQAKREEAQARTIWRWQLSPEGRAARAEVLRRSRCGDGVAADVSGSTPDPAIEDPSPVGGMLTGPGGDSPAPRSFSSDSESLREGRSPAGFHTPGYPGSTPGPAPSVEHAGIGGEAESDAAEFNGSVPSRSASTDEEADPPTRSLSMDPEDRAKRSLLIDEIRSCRLEDDAAYKRVWDQAQESFGPFDLINARIDVVRRFHVMCYAAIIKPAQRRRAL